jgi:hypothetical protein
MDDNKVAVLLEDLRAQFRTFGEGLQLLNDKVDKGFDALNNRMGKMETRMDRMEVNNHQEHQQLIQMVKELDTEVVKMKRVK